MKSLAESFGFVGQSKFSIFSPIPAPAWWNAIQMPLALLFFWDEIAYGMGIVMHVLYAS